jgi:hypothetical protein
LKLFGDIDEKKFTIKLHGILIIDSEKRKSIGKFIGESISAVPNLSELREWLNQIKDGETVFVLPGRFTSTEEKLIKLNLYKENNPNFDYQKYIEIQNIKTKIEEFYKMKIYTQKDKPIGMSDKELRRCLFCGKTRDEGVTFQKKAHAISESLGNKHLIQNEECDICNEEFGQSFEQDISTFLLPFRSLYGIIGKNGIPRQEKNSAVEFYNDKGIFTIVTSIEGSEEPYCNLPGTIELPISQKIIFQNIYKAFVKYFISLHGNNIREDLVRTCEWLKGKFEHNAPLPQIAIRLENSFFTKEPWAICYEKVCDDKRLPKYIFEFHFLMLIYIVIIPFVDDSEKVFCEDENYRYFWDHFPLWGGMMDWKFTNMDTIDKRKFKFNFNIAQREHD